MSNPPSVLSGMRPRLGNYVLREPVYKLDFDGDGKRDIGIWDPPTVLCAEPMPTNCKGHFIVLLSSKGFSQTPGQFLDVRFGGLGDVPVPADYDGDGRTDVAVYQPGGGINRDQPTSTAAYWRWCPTATPAESTSCTSPPAPIAYGSRADTPLPGLEFDGASGDELSYYRPSSGYWYARNVAGSFTLARHIGSIFGGAVPLPGLYDCDSLTDLAVYEPALGAFVLRRSEENWNFVLTRYFDPKLIPQPSGDAVARSGAMPLGSFTAPRYCTSGYYGSYKTRRSFAAFYPAAGAAEWHVLWSPIDSSTPQVCSYGDGALDQPIAGLDRDLDRRSDMALFRASSFDGLGWIYTRLSLAGACNGTDHNVYCSWCTRVRRRLWAVSDMTGDGKAEILMLAPDTMTIHWWTSESDYTSASSRTLGTVWADVL